MESQLYRSALTEILTVFGYICRNLLLEAEDDIDVLINDFTLTNKDLSDTDNELSVLKAEIQALRDSADRQKIAVEDAIKEDIVGAYKTIVANEKM